MTERMLYRDEVAEQLSLGRSAVYALIADGRLYSVKIGAARRVPHDAVVEYVESLRRSAA